MNNALLTSVQVCMMALFAGCLEVQGGALEAGWDIRDAGGGRIGCPGARSRVNLAWVRLALEPVQGGEDPCAADDRCLFACSSDSSDEILVGSTAFFLPEGTYAITSRPQSEDPASGKRAELTAADGVVAPAALVRDIRSGEVTDLDVNLIIVQR